MKRTLLLVLAPLFFLLSCKTTPEPVARYEIPSSNPDEASMDATMFAKMDSVSQALVDEGKLPGIEAMVIRGGKDCPQQPHRI